MLKNQRGFTLVEMMVVLLIISILLVITIPNITGHQSNITKKGEDAYIKMVEGQVQAYRMEYNVVPSVDELKLKGYLKDTDTTFGKSIVISEQGIVSLVK
jgi:competence protein ComGC